MTDVNIIKASNVKYYHKITVAEHSLFHFSIFKGTTTYNGTSNHILRAIPKRLSKKH